MYCAIVNDAPIRRRPQIKLSSTSTTGGGLWTPKGEIPGRQLGDSAKFRPLNWSLS